MTTQVYDSKLRDHVIEHAHREETASITAGNDLLANDITPSKTPCKLIIYISMAAAGKLDLTRNAVVAGERLNDDINLVVNTPYRFEIEVAKGDSAINLDYSVDSVINQLIVKEVPA